MEVINRSDPLARAKRAITSKLTLFRESKRNSVETLQRDGGVDRRDTIGLTKEVNCNEWRGGWARVGTH